jgi:hypothetical protein
VAVSKSADSLRFYVDGAHIGSKVLQGNPSTTTTAGTMLIGDDAPDPRPFNGNIAHLRIWNHARTQAEIQAAMDLSIPGNTPGLVSYWELNDGGGQVVLDKTSTADGQLGTSTALENMDPQWLEDCCELDIHTAVGELTPHDPLVHPNPTSDVLRIVATNAFANAEITLFDALGRMQKRWANVHGTTIQLDVRDLPTGSYQLMVQDETGRTVEQVLLAR